MFKRFCLWWKGYRSGLSYIGQVKRRIDYLNYEIKLVNGKIIKAMLMNNLRVEELNEDMIVTVNFNKGAWLFHVPVYQ